MTVSYIVFEILNVFVVFSLYFFSYLHFAFVVLERLLLYLEIIEMTVSTLVSLNYHESNLNHRQCLCAHDATVV